MATTEIEIIYHFNDGRRESLGTGSIDESGQIDITAPRAGQENYVAEQMHELNARDYVVLKLPPAPGGSRYDINKRKVRRDAPDFLSALKDYGMRVYRMEFVFDEFVLVANQSEEDDPAPAPSRAVMAPIFGEDS